MADRPYEHPSIGLRSAVVVTDPDCVSTQQPTTGAQFKTCPECAEEIRLDAVKCRFCGYRYEQAPDEAAPVPGTAAATGGFDWDPRAPAAAGSPAPVKRRSVARWSMLVAAGAVVVAVAVVMLTSSSASPRQTASSARASAYRACRSQTQATFSTLAALNSRLDVGMTLDAYTTQVGNVNVVVNQLPTRQIQGKCQAVISQLTNAAQSYIAAVTAWQCEDLSTCPVNIDPNHLPADFGDPQVDWTNASQDVQAATTALTAISGRALSTPTSATTAVAAAAEDAAAKELALSAEVAAETYATDHNGNYTGLTPAVLHSYESLIQIGPGGGNAYIARQYGVSVWPPGVGRAYSVTATSASGDTFTIARAIDGTISRSCTGSASTACTKGKW